MTVAQHGELTGKHRFQAGKSARDQRDVWTPGELRKLFASPIWTGRDPSGGRRAAPGTVITHDAHFWLPILALYQGARLEELADLYKQDVGREDGVWFIRLSEDERRLKNANAARRVPLHPEVLRLGFLAYVETIAPAPGDPLFPDLPPQGKDKKRGPRMTRWFVEYRREVGVYRPGVATHAFRHTARTRLSDALQTHQDERRIDHLFGHASGGGEGRERYDKGPGLKALAETLALLSYPEVDLTRHYQVSMDPCGVNEAR